MYPANTRILVVDDSPNSRQQVCSELTQLGFTNILEAADGREAFTKVMRAHEAGTPVKIIISDWNMPHMTGLEFLQKIRSTAELASPVFLMVTSESEMAQVTMAIASGADNYILKPIQQGTLTKKLEAAWKKGNLKKSA